jgi:3-oxoacyl-[acyl-carrier-protein] synthase-3
MPFIAGLHYGLGEQEIPVEQLAEFEQVCAEHKLPRAGAIFGWGVARRTASPIELASRCLAGTMAQREDRPIDLMIVATSGLLSPFAQQNLAIGRVIATLGASVSEVLCVSGAGCASGLNALVLANELVSMGRYREILVLCVDSLDGSIAKFSEYAVFSDGVSSFLVTREAQGADYAIESSFKQIFLDEMLDMSVAVQKKGGIKDYLRDASENTEAILSNNTFLPIKKMKDSQFGFRKTQLYLDNVRRVGHCVSSDCFINLKDYRTNRQAGDDFRTTLYADAAGHASAVILASCDSR